MLSSSAKTTMSYTNTKYDRMRLEADKPILDVVAYAATWILLAGFVMLPGTFTSTSTEDRIAIEAVQAAFQNVSLMTTAAICCSVGVAGMCGLWWRQRRNYYWLGNRIFL
jgi:hypothetical protein